MSYVVKADSIPGTMFRVAATVLRGWKPRSVKYSTLPAHVTVCNLVWRVLSAFLVVAVTCAVFGTIVYHLAVQIGELAHSAPMRAVLFEMLYVLAKSIVKIMLIIGGIIIVAVMADTVSRAAKKETFGTVTWDGIVKRYCPTVTLEDAGVPVKRRWIPLHIMFKGTLVLAVLYLALWFAGATVINQTIAWSGSCIAKYVLSDDAQSIAAQVSCPGRDKRTLRARNFETPLAVAVFMDIRDVTCDIGESGSYLCRTSDT